MRIARARLARAVASSDRAEAGLREADASRAAIEAQLSDTRLAAPIDGVVSLIKAQVGEVIAPGAAIARVFDPANLMIRFQVPRYFGSPALSSLEVRYTTRWSSP